MAFQVAGCSRPAGCSVSSHILRTHPVCSLLVATDVPECQTLQSEAELARLRDTVGRAALTIGTVGFSRVSRFR